MNDRSGAESCRSGAPKLSRNQFYQVKHAIYPQRQRLTLWMRRILDLAKAGPCLARLVDHARLAGSAHETRRCLQCRQVRVWRALRVWHALLDCSTPRRFARCASLLCPWAQ